MLEKATALIVVMVKQLRDKSHGEKIKDNYEQLQAIEGEADKIICELLRELYGGSYPPIKVVFLKDIFELLENERGAFVSGKPPCKADGQGVGIQQLVERDEISMGEPLALDEQTPAGELDQVGSVGLADAVGKPDADVHWEPPW